MIQKMSQTMPLKYVLLYSEAIPAQRRKQFKLLDINSEEEISQIELPTPEEIKEMIPAEVGLIYCNQLFFIEKGLKGMPSETCKAKRLELEVPVSNAFWEWIDMLDPLGGSKLAKAVTYAKNHRYNDSPDQNESAFLLLVQSHDSLSAYSQSLIQNPLLKNHL